MWTFLPPSAEICDSPSALVSAFCVPATFPSFNSNLLGGVLFGIGIALNLEKNNEAGGGVGLGLGGAIAINLYGGLVLLQPFNFQNARNAAACAIPSITCLQIMMIIPDSWNQRC